MTQSIRKRSVTLAGHRTSHGAEFRHLDKLVPGDEVVFTTDATTRVPSVVATPLS